MYVFTIYYDMFLVNIDYVDDYVEYIPFYLIQLVSFRFVSFRFVSFRFVSCHFNSIVYLIELLKRGLRTFTAAATDAKRTFTLHPSSRHIGT